jgi:hypothetical protein
MCLPFMLWGKRDLITRTSPSAIGSPFHYHAISYLSLLRSILTQSELVKGGRW